MSPDEAQACCERIRSGLQDIRALILDLHDRQGYTALGYKSWRECVTAEFGKSESYLYRQLQAALLEREVSLIGETEHIPESQLRPLGSLPPGERADAWEEAKATARGRLTAAHVAATAKGKSAAAPEAADAEPAEATGWTRLDGKLIHDPPVVARARADGAIASDVIPDVTSADAAAETSEAEPQGAELADKEWVATLPPSRMFAPDSHRLREFTADAILYRRTEPARDAFQPAVRPFLTEKAGHQGEWDYRLGWVLKTDHPRDWTICPPNPHGCNGTGEIPASGPCRRCHGRGYSPRP